jgi:hypothetical protein
MGLRLSFASFNQRQFLERRRDRSSDVNRLRYKELKNPVCDPNVGP